MAPQSVQDNAVLARLDSLTELVVSAAKDAREGRDGVIKLTATLLAERYGERIEALAGEMKRQAEAWEVKHAGQSAEFRADLVNAIRHEHKLRDDGAKMVLKGFGEAEVKRGMIESRLMLLEKRAEREDGAKGLAGVLMKHLPGALTGAIAGLATVFGMKGHI